MLFPGTLWTSADFTDRSESRRTYQRYIRLCCGAKYQKSTERKPENEKTEDQGQDSPTDVTQPPS